MPAIPPARGYFNILGFTGRRLAELGCRRIRVRNGGLCRLGSVLNIGADLRVLERRRIRINRPGTSVTGRCALVRGGRPCRRDMCIAGRDRRRPAGLRSIQTLLLLLGQGHILRHGKSRGILRRGSIRLSRRERPRHGLSLSLRLRWRCEPRHLALGNRSPVGLRRRRGPGPRVARKPSSTGVRIGILGRIRILVPPRSSVARMATRDVLVGARPRTMDTRRTPPATPSPRRRPGRRRDSTTPASQVLITIDKPVIQRVVRARSPRVTPVAVPTTIPSMPTTAR